MSHLIREGSNCSRDGTGVSSTSPAAALAAAWTNSVCVLCVCVFFCCLIIDFFSGGAGTKRGRQA